MDKQQVIEGLVKVLEAIDKQEETIRSIHEYDRTQPWGVNVEVEQTRDSHGQYVMVPLLIAKANAYSALAHLTS